MKVEPVRAPKFAGVVRKHGGAVVPPTPVLVRHEPNDPLAILLTNYLLWESTSAAAEAALAQLSRVVVDANELRVMLEPEVAEAIGSKYPFVEERARRLRATLNDIFRRQHRTSLDHLRNASRKEQRQYIESLAEIPPYVAGRTLAVAFELPSAAVDDTTVEVLHQQGVVEPTATTLEVTAWINKHHRMEELPKVNVALHAMSREAMQGGGKQATKWRDAYLARHDGFRTAVEAERRKVEDERRAREQAAADAAEARRLAEVAREEARIQAKREAEEAKIRVRAERERARVAANIARERAKAEREALRIKREAERVRAAEAKRRAMEREQARRAARAAKEEARAAIVARRAAERARLQKMKQQALERRRALKAKADRAKVSARAAAQAKKQAMKKQAMKKQAMKKQAMKKSSAKKSSAKKSSPKKSSPKKSSFGKASPKRTSPSKSSPKKAVRSPKPEPKLSSRRSGAGKKSALASKRRPSRRVR
jgi:hypothetical protein